MYATHEKRYQKTRQQVSLTERYQKTGSQESLSSGHWQGGNPCRWNWSIASLLLCWPHVSSPYKISSYSLITKYTVRHCFIMNGEFTGFLCPCLSFMLLYIPHFRLAWTCPLLFLFLGGPYIYIYTYMHTYICIFIFSPVSRDTRFLSHLSSLSPHAARIFSYSMGFLGAGGGGLRIYLHIYSCSTDTSYLYIR